MLAAGQRHETAVGSPFVPVPRHGETTTLTTRADVGTTPTSGRTRGNADPGARQVDHATKKQQRQNDSPPQLATTTKGESFLNQIEDELQPACNNRLIILYRSSRRLFLVDTGADASILPRPACIDPNTYTPDPTEAVSLLFAANRTPIRTYGLTTITLNLGLRRDFPHTFIYADVKATAHRTGLSTAVQTPDRWYSSSKVD